MSELKHFDMWPPNFQDPVDSFPIRKTFANLRAANNDNVRQLAQIALQTVSGDEVTLARDYADVLIDRLRAVTKGAKTQVISGLVVSEQSTPDMTIKVSAGDAIVNGVYCRKGLNRSWTRVVAGVPSDVITITEPSHGFTAEVSVIHVESTSETLALPEGTYTVQTTPDDDTFTVTGLDDGDLTGTCDYGRDLDALTAPALLTDKRLDYVVLNSDNSFSVITGTEATQPKFPARAESQCVIGGVVLKNDTEELENYVNIFRFHHDETDDLEDIYFDRMNLYRPGSVNCNNLIMEAPAGAEHNMATTSDRNEINFRNRLVTIRCKGWFYQVGLGFGTPLMTREEKYHNAAVGSKSEPTGGDGGTFGSKNGIIFNLSGGYGGAGSKGRTASPDLASGGPGAGGGGSIFAAGGKGGASTNAHGGEGSAGTDETYLGGRTRLALLIIARDVYMSSGISLTGEAGAAGAANDATTAGGVRQAGGGGGGGGAGGVLGIFARNSVTLTSGCTLDLKGGAGGAGGAANNGTQYHSGGGGGGGGAGGYLFIRAKSITNDATIEVAGGLGGAGGVASGGSVNNEDGDAGSPGSAGGSSILLYDDYRTNGMFLGSVFPFGELNLGFLE